MKNLLAEESFEDEVCQALLDNGWVDRGGDYDKDLALYPDDILAWLQTSGQLQDGDPLEVARGVARQIEEIGTIRTLREGFSYRGQQIRLVQFRPANNLNAKLLQNYQSNILRIDRQLYYSKQNTNSLDIVASLNGIPIWTSELKSSFKQSVRDAIEQYRRDRLPEGEPLLQRVPVHFAASSAEIFSTNKLAGEDTVFQPFLNPDEETTLYFWEQLGKRRETLNLYENFFFRGMFPRYNQWKAVTEVIKDYKYSGAGVGKRYLLEHSPGSGKTMTIATLANQLAFLHDDAGENLVDAVLVVTNRRILDDQAGKAVSDAEKVQGVVAVIEGKGSSKSKEFRQAVEAGNRVLVVTLPTLMYLDQDPAFRKLMSSNRFAVIIDEAHSGQSGSMSQQMRDALSGAEESAEDYFNQKLRSEKKSPTSYIAFTATPKEETLAIFGRGGRAFHSYSMRQAEEEGMIMPVLDKVVFLAGSGLVVLNGEKYAYDKLDKSRGQRALQKWVESQDQVLAAKLVNGMTAFLNESGDDIGGESKVMVGCSSRWEAARMKQTYDSLAKDRGWPENALVSFTGTVEIDGKELGEKDLNGQGGDIAELFSKDGCRVLIVADKFQVGFDEPRLCGLILNKGIGEPSALVQTYSRVNRIHPGKETTVVVDFINSPEEVYDAFAIYREGTNLEEDPISLQELDEIITKAKAFSDKDIQKFESLWKKRKPLRHSDIAAVFTGIADNYRKRLQSKTLSQEDESALRELPRRLRQRVRLYVIQRQTTGFQDSAEEAVRTTFYEYLSQILKAQRDKPEPILLESKITLDEYGIHVPETKEPRDKLERDPAPPKDGDPDSQKAYLRDLLWQLNREYASDPLYEAWVRELVVETCHDPAVVEQAQANDRRTFVHSPVLKKTVAGAAITVSSQNDDYKKYLQTMGGREISLIGEAAYDQLSEDVLNNA